MRTDFVAALLLAGCGRPGIHPVGGAWQPAIPAVDPAWQAGAGERAAVFASLQYGKPYCVGGIGPDCFDCSGLTFAAWQSAGLAIPRTSAAQHDKLAVVPLGPLTPGDILWRPGHVGLYLGGGWVIHAPGRGKAVQFEPVHIRIKGSAQTTAKYAAAHRPASSAAMRVTSRAHP